MLHYRSDRLKWTTTETILRAQSGSIFRIGQRAWKQRLIINFKSSQSIHNFAATSHNPIDKRLDFSSYFLSLIKVLHLQGEIFDSIRKICLEVVTEYVRPKNKIQQLLKRLPPKLIHMRLASVFLKAFNKRVSTNSNSQGFVANIITDKQKTYGLGYGIDIPFQKAPL